MANANDVRFEACLKAELNRKIERLSKKAVAKCNGGKTPKKNVAAEIMKTEKYEACFEQLLESEGANEIKKSLESKQTLEEAAKSGKYDKTYAEYCRKHETPEEKAKRLEEEKKLKEKQEEFDKLVEKRDFSEIGSKAVKEISEKIITEIEEILLETDFPNTDLSDFKPEPYSYYGNWNEPKEYSYEGLLETILEYGDDSMSPTFVAGVTEFSYCSDDLFVEYVLERDPELEAMSSEETVDSNSLFDKICNEDLTTTAVEIICSYFTKTKVESLLAKNTYMQDEFKRIEQERKREEEARLALLERIPDNVVDLYPLARKLNRNFTLHVGPTNSGKTHSAVEAMKNSGSGAYFGPLRLLAYEQYEKLNSEGYPCSLVTGEERVTTENAEFVSSTIEMADFTKRYAHAVIDEAQMLSDPSRGGAWTAAILGLRCEDVSVCLSPDAEDVVVRLIEVCGDKYEIVRHERKVPLETETEPFGFPNDVRDGDALIVFSKQNVHAVAAELQKKHVACSVVYGALPYDVRHEEARRFAEKETKVLVATDAVGMGLNLPINRVVFLETTKFDGKKRRPLRTQEIKQIGGRAGRYGIYDEGLVSSCDERKTIEKALQSEDAKIEKAVLSFPESILGADGKLSEIMERWLQLEDKEGFVKSDLEEKLDLCEYAEKSVSDKKLVYDLVMLPFDSKNPSVRHAWELMVSAKAFDSEPPFDSFLKEYASACVSKEHVNADDLSVLETAHKICDLTYAYSDKFGYPERAEEALERKKVVSSKIMEILKRQKLKGRRCKYCGSAMRWNYPYGMCSKCHDKRYPKRYDWDYGYW